MTINIIKCLIEEEEDLSGCSLEFLEKIRAATLKRCVDYIGHNQKMYDENFDRLTRINGKINKIINSF